MFSNDPDFVKTQYIFVWWRLIDSISLTHEIVVALSRFSVKGNVVTGLIYHTVIHKIMDKFIYNGILGNVDDTILSLSLPNGFEIKKIPLVEMLELGSILFNKSMNTIEQDWTYRHRSIIDSQLSNLKHPETKTTNDLFCYVLSKTYDVDIELHGNNYTIDDWDLLTQISNEFTFYVEPILLRTINLYKAGNVICPVFFEYIENNKSYLSFSSRGSSTIDQVDLFSLESGEGKQLSAFLNKFKIPEKNDYFYLALSNYELSYKTNIISLSYICLVTSLEVMFDPGAKNVASGTALLLGKEFEDSKKIAKEVKNLHENRSDLLHSGKPDKINNEELVKLREYTRRSLLETINLGLPKDKLIEKLKARGLEYDDLFK